MNSKKLILYSSVFAIQGLSNAVIPVLPELAGEGNASPAISSLLYSGYFVGALLTLLPFGILADRIGNLRVVGWESHLLLFPDFLFRFLTTCGFLASHAL
ncbi:MFS transporter [Methanosarcina horonobensis]|uniref:hypothetical protein n=1 Tax=Methanosarcina horonobensis TaxID=418008 RepID=UPI000AA979D7|nr:hypothetical protein [Methanosarcina horonobensis]